jgi:hypothetical protein
MDVRGGFPFAAQCGLHRKTDMKSAFNCVLLSMCVAVSGAYAAEPETTKREAEVQKDINSIVSTCEKKKLPAEQEIECIEQGFLEFMEEMAQQRAAALR